MQIHSLMRAVSYALLFFEPAGIASALAAPAVGGSIVVTTDYVFRGISQSGDKAALQADVHLRSVGGWFAGAWGSVAAQQPEFASEAEVNLYLGRAWNFTPAWTASLHHVWYLYPDDRPQAAYFYKDYSELQATLSFQDRAALSVAWAEDISRYSFAQRAIRAGHQWSWEASLRQPIWRNFSLTAGIGHYDLSDLFHQSYWAWSGGAAFSLRQLQFNLTRFGVDDAARRMFGEQTADGSWVFTAAWRF